MCPCVAVSATGGWSSERCDGLFIVGVVADPEPDEGIALLVCERAIVSGYPNGYDRKAGVDALEAQTRDCFARL